MSAPLGEKGGPCRWRRVSGGAGSGGAESGRRRGRGPRLTAPSPADPPARPGSGPIPGTAVAASVVVAALVVVPGLRAVPGFGRSAWWVFGRDRRERGRRGLQLFFRGPVVAADPVARRRPAGAAGPTNTPDGGEKGLLCQRPCGEKGGPCRWRQGLGGAGSGGAELGGGVVAVPGSRPHPRHRRTRRTRRPGLAAAPSPAPRWRLRSWWRLCRGPGLRAVQWAAGGGAAGFLGRDFGEREGVGALQLFLRRPGGCGRPGSSAPPGRRPGAD